MILLKRKNTLITGAAVMAVASVLCKILSAVFKIPLDRFFLHEEGIAVFQSVCSVYNVFLAFCVTGIPIALSSLVASEDEDARASLYKSTLVSITAICGFFSVLLFLFAENIAVLLSGGGDAVSKLAIRVSAPAILFMGVVAAERGYFQGKGNMLPSAVSQITESFVKTVLGTLLCAILIKKGISHGAAGAMAGVSFGTVLSASVLYLFHRKGGYAKGCFDLKLAVKILKLSLPVTLGAFGFTAVMLGDALTVPGILASSGLSETKRLFLFGCLTRANTIYNLPATVITAVTASIVPLIAAVKDDNEKLGESLLKSVKLLFIVALPCGFGLMLFAPEVLSLLYGADGHSALLVLTGALVIFVPYVQATTAALQATGKVYIPIIVTFAAVLLKVMLNYLLIPVLSIEGAPVSTLIAFIIAFIINTLMISKNLSIRSFLTVLIRLTVCGSISCIGARLLYMIHPSVYMLLICIMCAAVFYAVLLFITRTVERKDLL